MPLPLITLRTDAPDFCRTKLQQRWRAASGEGNFRPWNALRSRDKKNLFHNIALSLAEQGMVVRSAYEEIPIHTLMKMKKYSIEHIVPRIKINGRLPGDAENDPRGWWIADRATNSLRGNLPLALWPDPPGGPFPVKFIHRVGGVKHFFPPHDQRAMLARIWLFVRYNYRCLDVIDPPSAAQIENEEHICALAKVDFLPQEVEMNKKFKELYGVSNPLIEDSSWLDDPEFRYACFH